MGKIKNNNKTNEISYAVGFTIFLEHLLHYGDKEEKGMVSLPPKIQLGGSWNIAKTLLTLNRRPESIGFVGFIDKGKDARRDALETLLLEEDIGVKLLKLKDRIMNSYYLIPQRGKTWAFGDFGGKLAKYSKNDISILKKYSMNADLRFLSCLSSDPRELALAKIFYKRNKDTQKNILIPSVELITGGKVKGLFSFIDLLSLNIDEVKIMFDGNFKISELLSLPIPFALVTDGPNTAFLKAGKNIIEMNPKAIDNPVYIAGAGDSTTATLAYYLFVKGASPEIALSKALAVGTATIKKEESFFSK